MVGIIAFPLLGIAIAEMLHTRRSELLLFLLPAPMAAVQMFLAQSQVPDAGDPGRVVNDYNRAVRACVAWNQIAILPLVLTEAGAIIALRPDVP